MHFPGETIADKLLALFTTIDYRIAQDVVSDLADKGKVPGKCMPATVAL